MAAVVATAEPEIAAKKAHAITHTKDAPPLMCPTRLLAKLTRRLDSPPYCMIAPAITKKNMASMEY